MNNTPTITALVRHYILSNERRMYNIEHKLIPSLERELQYNRKYGLNEVPTLRAIECLRREYKKLGGKD